MQSLLAFQRLAGLGNGRLYSGQEEGETDEEFFCRQRAKQRAWQRAMEDCSPGGKAFHKAAPPGSKMWNQCLTQRSKLYERRFMQDCASAEELQYIEYYRSMQRTMTAGGKVPSPFTRPATRRKPEDEEGMKPFTGGKLPPSGVWPLPPVEGPSPTLKAGFTVQKQPTIILPPAPKPAGSALPKTVSSPVLNIPVPRALMPAPVVGMPARQAVALAPTTRATMVGAPAARAAGPRGGVLAGAPDYDALTVFKFVVGFFAGYWLMTDFLKKGRG